MIVKKMPILQGFEGPENVKKLSECHVKLTEFSPVFYDIETTGLARSSTFAYLIGAAAFEEGQWQLYQWLAESPEEEPALLEAFADFLRPFTCTIHYNGESFDQPYLEARCAHHGLPSPFDGKSSVDLFRLLKPCKSLLGLSGMKQPDLEAFLERAPRLYADGGQCIRLYRNYLQRRDPACLEAVLGHNQEDLLGLGAVFSMLRYLWFLQGDYRVEQAGAEDTDWIFFSLRLSMALPKPFSAGGEAFYLTADGQHCGLRLRLRDGRLRKYYENYKDYDYIPSEDTAIHKSLSGCMAKSLRKAARPETCYTWFTCTDAFLRDRLLTETYLRQTLPHYLKLFMKA